MRVGWCWLLVGCECIFPAESARPAFRFAFLVSVRAEDNDGSTDDNNDDAPEPEPEPEQEPRQGEEAAGKEHQEQGGDWCEEALGGIPYPLEGDLTVSEKEASETSARTAQHTNVRGFVLGVVFLGFSFAVRCCGWLVSFTATFAKVYLF